MVNKIVLAFGTFDIVHKGHVKFLAEAKKLGDLLYVVVARDSTVEQIKKKKTFYDQKTRKAMLAKLPFVDKVFLGHKQDKYKKVEDINPDIIALGYDQSHYIEKGLKEEIKKRGLKSKIVRLKSYKPERYKSSKIRPIKQAKSDCKSDCK